jgi:hypothetical protein
MSKKIKKVDISRDTGLIIYLTEAEVKHIHDSIQPTIDMWINELQCRTDTPLGLKDASEAAEELCALISILAKLRPRKEG